MKMTPRLNRSLGLIVGLVGVLGMASIVAGQSLSDQEIGQRIRSQLAKHEALGNVRVSMEGQLVNLSGTVPSLWAKTAAVKEARTATRVRSITTDSLTIESAESDQAIVDQIAADIWNVSIRGPSAAARAGVSTPVGITESQVPPRRFGDERRRGGPESQSLVSPDTRRAVPDSPGHGPDGRRYPVDFVGAARLQDQLDRALFQPSGNRFYGIFDHVDGWVDEGVVVLSGSVTHEYKATRVADLVSRVHGVQEILNRIEVLSTGAPDNRLRVELARNLYSNPLFWTDATRRSPPIRIIVDNLNVRLAGVVSSDVEKYLAADIARQTPGVLSFRNDLHVAGRDDPAPPQAPAEPKAERQVARAGDTESDRRHWNGW